MTDYTNKQVRFGTVAVLVVVAAIMVVAGYNLFSQSNKSTESKDTNLSINSSADYLKIKEWRVSIGFANASKITYKLDGPTADMDANGDKYIDSVKLYLPASITKDTDCQDLGVAINRLKPSKPKADLIRGYDYDILGKGTTCKGDPGGENGSISQLRLKIADELVSSKHTTRYTVRLD